MTQFIQIMELIFNNTKYLLVISIVILILGSTALRDNKIFKKISKVFIIVCIIILVLYVLYLLIK